MEEDKTVTTIFKLITAVVCTLIVSVSGCTANRQYQTRMLIESGKTDAASAKCAIDGDEDCRNVIMRDMVNHGR